MGDFYTITEFIRNEILNYYQILNQKFYERLYKVKEENDDIDNDDELIDIEDIENYYLEDNESNYEWEVFIKMIDKIEAAKYRKLAYLIIFQDVWEYLKTKQIINSSLLQYEEAMLEFLENNDIKDIFNKLETLDDFDLDLMTLFIEYHSTNDKENRMKSRKLIELTNNSKHLKKFKISLLDDIEYQYTKTRKIR